MDGQLTVNQEKDGWTVRYDGKFADRLTFDEALALVVQIMMPGQRQCRGWLKNMAGHNAWAMKHHGMTENEARVRSL